MPSLSLFFFLTVRGIFYTRREDFRLSSSFPPRLIREGEENTHRRKGKNEAKTSVSTLPFDFRAKCRRRRRRRTEAPIFGSEEEEEEDSFSSPNRSEDMGEDGGEKNSTISSYLLLMIFFSFFFRSIARGCVRVLLPSLVHHCPVD